MNNVVEQEPFVLSSGVDTYSPDITNSSLKLKRLKNVQPLQGRWVTPNGYTKIQDLLQDGEELLVIKAYSEPYEGWSQIYALTNFGVYSYNFYEDRFNTFRILNFDDTNINAGPIVCEEWYASLFVSRLGTSNLYKIEFDTVTPIVGALGARYGIVTNSHLMLAHMSAPGGNYPTRLYWSDLYDPEQWEIREDTEADYFELEPQDREITGLTNQRGGATIYTKNAIWVAQYNPLPTGYRFRALYTDIGAWYHGSVIQVKNVDYFIARDGIFALDGTQLKNIGTPIWSFFNETQGMMSLQDFTRVFVDPDKTEIAWIYKTKDGHYWSIVYNYFTDAWSDRDPQNIFTGLRLPGPAFSTRVIDDIDENFGVIFTPPKRFIDDYDDKIIDGSWQRIASTLSEAFGGLGGIYVSSNRKDKFDGSPIAWEFETYEFYLDKLFHVKEFDKLLLSMSGVGKPNVKLYIGTRRNRMEEVKWSEPISLSEQLDGELVFFHRNKGIGKLVRFRVAYENTSDSYISELTHIGVSLLNDAPDSPEK